MRIIGVTGLPSSGKGEFSNTAKSFGFHEIVMGDIIRSEVSKRNLPMTRENSNKIMIQLREERGNDIVAELTGEKIDLELSKGRSKILIDGIRSMAEVEFFKKKYTDLQIVAIHADPQTRYQRSLSRKRQDDANSRKSFEERDIIELGVGIGNVIANADILIISPSTIQEAKSVFEEVLNEILSETPELVS